MKKVSIFALIALGSLSIGVTSCSKEDPAKALEINKEQTATIHGKILINKNESDSIPKWSSAENVQIIASVPYAELNSAASGTYLIKDVTYNAATGEFTIVAPVSANGSAINVKFADFKGQVVVPTIVDDTVQTSKTINVIWKGQSTTTEQLLPGEAYNLPNWQLNGSAYYTEDPSVGDGI